MNKFLLTSLMCLALVLQVSGISHAVTLKQANTKFGSIQDALIKKVTRIDPRKMELVIGDITYRYDATLVVHTAVTNFGTVRSLKIGDTVKYKTSVDRQGKALVSEIWVTSQSQETKKRR